VAEAASPRVAYRGFISYSHRDERAGAKLHRRLETYKLPKQLVGTETKRGLVPQRLTPIFRDREELSAGASLSLQVQEALAGSDALIILCSPNAKASDWVGKEIETFRALHPDRPILAAILEGGPDDAFPDALTWGGAEPIAADLRKGKDGWRLGELKLIAGMTGVPLDSLVQRDAQRQLRRVTAITVGALIAMLIMALLLVAALRARAEADRQRTEAEGLVEYMLTDLRDKLKGVGRLDVMTAVNERAMKHYGEQGDLASLPPESLNRRARILHAMGEDDEKRGDLGLALKKFGEAHRTTAAVLAQRPNDPDAIFAHAQSEYWVGRVAELQGQFSDARSRYVAYGEAARRLLKSAPENPDYLMEVAWGCMNIGNIDLQTRKAPKFGQNEYEEGVRWMLKAASLKPTNAAISAEISNAYAWLADSLWLQGNISGSLAMRNKQLGTAIATAGQHPRNSMIRFEVTKARYSVARNFVKAGRASEARPYFEAARREMESLVKLEGSNSEWNTILARINDELKQPTGGTIQ
jgi:tetratricopeptide (TPR) repeat protein